MAIPNEQTCKGRKLRHNAAFMLSFSCLSLGLFINEVQADVMKTMRDREWNTSVRWFVSKQRTEQSNIAQSNFGTGCIATLTLSYVPSAHCRRLQVLSHSYATSTPPCRVALYFAVDRHVSSKMSPTSGEIWEPHPISSSTPPLPSLQYTSIGTSIGSAVLQDL